MTDRLDKNFARAVMREFGRRPRTAGWLAEYCGYELAFVQNRLREWCEEGRAIGRIVGTDQNGQPVIAYRPNPNFDPSAPVPPACDETQEVADAA